MLKIFLMIASFAVCALIGVYLKTKMSKKEKLLCAFANFCESTKSQISFLQTNLNTLIENEKQSRKGEFSDLLDSYLKKLKSGEQIKKPKLLTDNEWEIMSNIFNKLGKSDVKNQEALLENSRLAIAPMVESAKEKNKKDGTMWLKLFICLGVAIVIVLI